MRQTVVVMILALALTACSDMLPEPTTPRAAAAFPGVCAAMVAADEYCGDAEVTCTCDVVVDHGESGAVIVRAGAEYVRYYAVLRTADGATLVGAEPIEVIAEDAGMCKVAENHVAGVSVTRDGAAVVLAVAITWDTLSNCEDTGVARGEPLSTGNVRTEALRCTQEDGAPWLVCERFESDQLALSGT